MDLQINALKQIIQNQDSNQYLQVKKSGFFWPSYNVEVVDSKKEASSLREINAFAKAFFKKQKDNLREIKTLKEVLVKIEQKIEQKPLTLMDKVIKWLTLGFFGKASYISETKKIIDKLDKKVKALEEKAKQDQQVQNALLLVREALLKDDEGKKGYLIKQVELAVKDANYGNINDSKKAKDILIRSFNFAERRKGMIVFPLFYETKDEENLADQLSVYLNSIKGKIEEKIKEGFKEGNTVTFSSIRFESRKLNKS